MAAFRAAGTYSIATASSGIAATLLNRTAHSRFGISIPILPTSTCNVKKTQNGQNLIPNTELIEDVERGAELSFPRSGPPSASSSIFSPKCFGFFGFRHFFGFRQDRQTDAINMFWAFLVLKN